MINGISREFMLRSMGLCKGGEGRRTGEKISSCPIKDKGEKEEKAELDY